MTDAERLKTLSDAGRTVYALRDLRRLWRMRPATAKIAAKRMFDRKLLHRVARGYFALKPDFDPLELANLIITPSYVSLFSALAFHGLSFQARGTVTSVALLNYRRQAAGLEFRYHAMKPSLFYNLEDVRVGGAAAMSAAGVVAATIAGPERALLDALYFGLLPDVDHPEKLNPERLLSVAAYYPSSVRRRAERYVSP
jgi:hypothetical protein